MEITGLATRTAGSVHESAGWVERNGQRHFVFLHRPAQPTAALVVCSPVGGEADTNRRREVLLARALAGRGVAVLRHDYRGTGNSDGEPDELSFESMCDDARFAVELVSGETGHRPVLLGTRLGGLVAAVAGRETGAGLVLWHPCRDGRGYYREVGMLRQMNKLAQQANRDVAETRPLKEELAAEGRIELAGYEMHQRLYETTIGLALAQFEPPGGTSALVLEFDGTELSAWLESLTGEWRSRGVECRAGAIPERENWWFANDLVAEEDRLVTRAAIEATVEWVGAGGRPDDVVSEP
jgi:alpha/beta superfamily hydrolase